MKKERVIIFVGTIAFILVITFLSFAKTYGASSVNPSIKSNSKNQLKETSKPAYEQSSRVLADPSIFTPDMPFSEAIDILRNSTKPPLNIAVLWRDLGENADIYRDTPIGMEGLSGVPLRTHLEILLMSVSAGSPEKLKYTVEDGVVIIATEDSLPIKRTTRIYDITDLAAAPANYFIPPMGFGGMMPYGGYGGAYGGMRMPYGGMRPNGGLGFGGSYGGASYMGLYGGGYRSAYGSPYGFGRTPGTRSPYGFNAGSELAGLIDTLYGHSKRNLYKGDRRTRGK